MIRFSSSADSPNVLFNNVAIPEWRFMNNVLVWESDEEKAFLHLVRVGDMVHILGHVSAKSPDGVLKGEFDPRPASCGRL